MLPTGGLAVDQFERRGKPAEVVSPMTPRRPVWRAKLKHAREVRRLTQKEAAEKAGIGRTTWGNVESGYERGAGGARIPYTPGAQTLAKMAVVCNLDPFELVKEAGLDPEAIELATLPVRLDATPPEVVVYVVQVKGQPLDRVALAEYVYKQLLAGGRGEGAKDAQE
jgi:transcriptional regulator with XRE-family HTH domain